MKRKGLLDDVGGISYLGELCSNKPSAAELPRFAEIILDKAIKRSLIHECGTIATDASDEVGSGQELLERAEQSVFNVSQSHLRSDGISIASAVNAVLDDLDRKQELGLMTGLPTVDRRVGGILPGELVLVAARTSVGKTAIATWWARRLAAQGHPVLFFSLEQRAKEIATRLLASESSVSSHTFRAKSYNADEFNRISDAAGAIRKLPITIYDARVLPDKSLYHIVARARRHRVRDKIRAVFVDYVQFLDPGPADRKKDRFEQLGIISRRLKHLAVELDIPVVAMAQLNRNAEDRTEPKLSDLRGSGDLEQDADQVYLLHVAQEDLETDPAPLRLIVAKNRNGDRGSFDLTFSRSTYSFEEAAPAVSGKAWHEYKAKR